MFNVTFNLSKSHVQNGEMTEMRKLIIRIVFKNTFIL